jgi:hypothetical protein
MTYFLIIGCVVCGWAVLRIIGSERTMLISDMETRLRKSGQNLSAAAAAPPAADAQTTPAAKAPAIGKTKN